MELYINPKRDEWNQLLKRPTQSVGDIEATVKRIFEDVKTNGDKAISKYTLQFDNVEIENLIAGKEEINKAITQVNEELKQAIVLAKNNIEKFHEAQITKKVSLKTMKGVKCWQEKRPIQKVGLYIPGGTAPLFSTVLMLAVPAQLAGCKEIVLCTPPNKEGKIPNEILYAAQLCGVTKIIKAGGIQAIAGLTFGTKSIPQVYKIFGPGNQFVTVAKQLATQFGVAIDMPAGPSELLVMADESANAAYVASDLLSQAEHGADSQVILVTTSKSFAQKVHNEVEKQLKELPRKEIASKAIANSKTLIVENFETGLELIDEYGPEHFVVATDDNDFFCEQYQQCGFCFYWGLYA
jgi:histidinol dehydrogenase